MNQFSYSDLKLAHMSIAQGQNTWTGKKAIMCQILASNHALLQNMIKTWQVFYIFFNIDLELEQITVCQNLDTPSGHTQSLCNVKLSMFLQKREINWPETILAFSPSSDLKTCSKDLLSKSRHTLRSKQSLYEVRTSYAFP